VKFLNLLENTISAYGIIYFLSSFVGYLGWLDTPIPEIVVYSYLVLLFLVALFDKSHKIKISPFQRIFMFISTISFLLLIVVGAYLNWTPEGLKFIEGIQGRYFIPFAPLIFILFYNRIPDLEIRKKRIGLELVTKYKAAITIFIMLTLMIALVILVKRYYLSLPLHDYVLNFVNYCVLLLV
ncbi:MAG TPA: DUF2142 domain-containing protein, partial [Methanobacteriaceae archaeon]|nr:DUF2142 domain-containing protein [Methanobacteriaceae archaeon]